MREGIKNNWMDSQLAAAKNAVQQGTGVHAAAAKFNIPKSTLHDRISSTSSKWYGDPPAIQTPAEEKEIVCTCLVM